MAFNSSCCAVVERKQRLEKFVDKYSKWIDADDIGQFIVYHEDKPSCYISWSDVATDPIRKETYPERTYGIDLFIADLGYIGKGYGPELIKQFIKQIIMPMKPTKIIVDPEITNLQAIRAYEKVGFKKTQVGQATDGTKMVTAQLMELDPLMYATLSDGTLYSYDASI